jgi:hypothetical protein
MPQSNFELPKQLDRYLAALSKLYAQEDKRRLQEIIVNATTRIDEGSSYDNWNDGTYGHTLHLFLPEALFLTVVNSKTEIQNALREDLNKIHNIRNEFIEAVFLDVEPSDDPNWRAESGLYLIGQRVVTPESARRIWDDREFRVFLSHKAEVKKETALLKQALKPYGVSSFVAHEDIHPTKEWQDEIENALSSMDAFVALLTPDFHESAWTDQEVGFAFARRVPLISVKLGKDPYGFIGKFQALSCSWDAAPMEILGLLASEDRMIGAFINKVTNCRSWDEGNILARFLPSIQRLSEEQIDQLVSAFNANGELQGSFGFNESYTKLYGKGLVFHLNRLARRKFQFRDSKVVELTP